jgi:hypothetical protein
MHLDEMDFLHFYNDNFIGHNDLLWFFLVFPWYPKGITRMGFSWHLKGITTMGFSWYLKGITTMGFSWAWGFQIFRQYFVIIPYLPIVCEDWDILMVLDIKFYWIDAKFNYREIMWSEFKVFSFFWLGLFQN